MFNNKQTKLYRTVLVWAIFLVPAILIPTIWVVASVVAPTYEIVSNVDVFYKTIHPTHQHGLVRTRVKNNSIQNISGSFRLVIENANLPVLNASGINQQGEPYILFKKGVIRTIKPGKTARVIFRYRADLDNTPFTFNPRFEQRITPSTNNQPIANAGVDQLRNVGDVVYLDASKSIDLDGNRLNYQWQLERKPKNSNTTLVNVRNISPSFNLDVKGRYIFTLTVNDGIENSHYDRVIVNTSHLRPQAQAGRDLQVTPGENVTLDGSASTDANGDILSYLWVIEKFPEGSTAALENPRSVKPKINIDSSGEYILRLNVHDGKHRSLPDHIRLSDGALPPVANAGVDQGVITNDLVQLDASVSYAPNAQPLNYRWALIAAPDNSTSVLSEQTSLNPSLLIDQPGDYIIQLIVNDGIRDSQPDQLIVSTNNIRPIAEAGEEQTILIDAQAQLNAGNSADANGDVLTYQWALIHKPATSTAALTNVNDIISDFVADVGGQYVVQLIVNDGQLNSYADTVIINAEALTNKAPVIQSTAVLITEPNVLYTYNVVATDDDGDILSYTLPQAPSGMIINPVNGAITWTPAAAGTFSVTVQVSDGQGGEDAQAFTLTVKTPNVAPSIQSSPLLAAKTDALYSYAVIATDNNNDPLNYLLLQSPTGMVLDASSGKLTWTPTIAGSFNVEIQASDGRGGIAKQAFIIVVTPLNQTPVIQTSPILGAQVNTPYTYTVFAIDADNDPLLYSLTQSPTGMSINSISGLISWTPSVTAFETITLQASDGRGGIDTQQFVINVTQSNSPPVINSTPPTAATIDKAYQYTVQASDTDNDNLSYRLISAPLGMNINRSTGNINWLPIDASSTTGSANVASIEIEVDDGKGGKANQQYSINVSYPAGNTPPIFAPLPDKIVPIGTKLQLQFVALDPEGEAIQYSALPLPLPANAVLNTQTGVLTFAPQADQAGGYTLIINASDPRFSTTQSQKITVPPLDLNAPTSFRGRVLDANSAAQNVIQPIVGATVSFLNTTASTVTDAQGYFTLDNIPATATVFSINGATADFAPGGASYASFREKLSFIEHAENVKQRPFYMPRNDAASSTPVDPNQVTMVENETLGVTLEIPKNAAINDDGTPFIGQISITEVPPGLAPATLPVNFNPALLVTIQPAGIRFTTPAPITFPNLDNLPPGTEFSIMSVNPNTGVFEVVGTAQVSVDGKSIVTTSGGIRDSDWSFPSVQAVDDVSVSTGDNEGTKPKCTGSTTCLKDGRMSQSVSLPQYRSLEADRAVSLTYQTSRAGEVAQALQNLGTTRFGNRSRIRIKITYKLVRAGATGFGQAAPPTPDYTKISTTIAGIEGGETYIGIPPLNQNNVFTGIALEAGNLGTGMYTATTTVVVKIGFSVSGITKKTETLIINESSSPFGAGWMIENIDRLHFHATTGTALLVSADGRYKIYRFDKTTQTYTTPKGNFSTLIKNADNTYTLTDQFGNQSFFNARGLQTQSQDLNGNSTLYTYNADNALTLITDPVGKETRLNYSNGRITSITDPANRITRFEHDGVGNLTRIIYPDDSEMNYQYAGHLMTKKTDERNNTTQYHYDAEGFNTHVTLPDNKQRGVKSSLAKGFGVQSSTINNPLDSFFDKSSGTYINARGNTTEFELDDRSFTTKQIDALGRITLYQRDSNSLPLKTTRANGSIVQKTFDNLGNTLSEQEDFNNARYQYSYDNHSLITRITNPNSNSVSVTRDANGNPIEIINELGHTTNITFDSRGLPTRIITPNKLEIIRTYNADGLLQSQTETPPAGSPGEVRSSGYQYFDSGLLKQVNTADGRTYTYTYDQRSRLLSISDNLNQKQTAQYDSYGNIIEVDTANADGSLALQIKYGYDSRNRITEMRLPHQQTDAITRLLLDGEDNITELIDPKGSSRTMSYDKVDRLDKNVHRLNGKSQYSYDLNDQITQVISPNGAITNYAYDLLGRRLSETSPDRGSIQYQYDLADNLIQQIDARSITTNYSYDKLERLRAKIFPDKPTENVALNYDTCPFGIGRLCAITDETGNSDYQYDAWGNVSQHQKTELGQSYITAYQYDKGNNINQMRYPSGRVITISRDGVRRIQAIQTSLNQNGGTTSQSLMANTLYRADDQAVQYTFGNGLSGTRQYDLQGRLTAQSTSNGASITDQRQYSYDINSNLTNRTTSAQTSNYNYDLLDRLTQDSPSSTVNLAARQSTIQYDQNHNRQRKTSYLPDLATASSTQTKAYNYNSLSNQLLAEETLNDNLPLNASNQAEQLQYNAANRLSQHTISDATGNILRTTNYLYNAKGQRTRKTNQQTNGSSATTIYHYNLDGQLISETTENGESLRDYIWHKLSPIAQIESAQSNQQSANDAIYYLHTDHLFTPRFATNSSKQIIWRWEGEAFGETKAEEDVDGDGQITTVNLRFPGQYYDAESGTHYNYYRDYDPSLGRYITSDPIGLFAGLNTFGYVDGNPLAYIDPDGKILIQCLIGALVLKFLYETYTDSDNFDNGAQDAKQSIRDGNKFLDNVINNDLNAISNGPDPMSINRNTIRGAIDAATSAGTLPGTIAGGSIPTSISGAATSGSISATTP